MNAYLQTAQDTQKATSNNAMTLCVMENLGCFLFFLSGDSKRGSEPKGSWQREAGTSLHKASVQPVFFPKEKCPQLLRFFNYLCFCCH